MFASKKPRCASWDQVISSRGEMFPWLHESADPIAGRIELVTRNDRLLPAVILRAPETSFRTQLSDATPATVLMDVVTVKPFPTPFGYLIPIIFDDPVDPFWRQIHLNLFRIDTMCGAPILQTAPYDPLASRKIVRAFSQARQECGLVVFDPDNVVRFSKITECCNLTDERAVEIAEVMTFLDRFEIRKDYEDCAMPQEAFANLFCTRINVPGTKKTVVVPKNRSSMFSDMHVFSIKVVGDRLLDRAAFSGASNTNPARCVHDVFVSHAHVDSKMAHAVADWLKLIWPDIRIFLTKPDDEKRFLEDPAYFVKELQASKCILHLLTPNSFGRPMVGVEVTGSLKPVVTLMVGVTAKDLKPELQNNLFFALDEEKTVEIADKGAWPRLSKLLSDATGLPKRTVSAPPPGFSVDRVVGQDGSEAWQRYYKDSLFIAVSSRTNQTEAEAEALVTDFIKEQLIRLGKPGLWDVVSGFNARHKLIQCLLWWNDESEWRDVMEYVSALVDGKLIARMALMMTEIAASGDSESAMKIRRMQFVARDVAKYIAESRQRGQANSVG